VHKSLAIYHADTDTQAARSVVLTAVTISGVVMKELRAINAAVINTSIQVSRHSPANNPFQ